MFTNLVQLGPELPNGWHRPTKGLIEEILQNHEEGLALPSARHLYVRSEKVTMKALSDLQVDEGIRLLASYCNPSSSSKLQAVGMAYPQLARAADGSFRVLAINMGMPDARGEYRQTTVRVFYNPEITPIESEGWEWKRESCFSAPGISAEVKRWKSIIVREWGGQPYRFDGAEAWFMQHEFDHLDGIICIMRAMEHGGELYYVPPETARTFYQEYNGSNWPRFSKEQWWAMITGEFKLESYAELL